MNEDSIEYYNERYSTLQDLIARYPNDFEIVNDQEVYPWGTSLWIKEALQQIALYNLFLVRLNNEEYEIITPFIIKEIQKYKDTLGPEPKAGE